MNPTGTPRPDRADPWVDQDDEAAKPPFKALTREEARALADAGPEKQLLEWVALDGTWQANTERPVGPGTEAMILEVSLVDLPEGAASAIWHGVAAAIEPSPDGAVARFRYGEVARGAHVDPCEDLVLRVGDQVQVARLSPEEP